MSILKFQETVVLGLKSGYSKSVLVRCLVFEKDLAVSKPDDRLREELENRIRFETLISDISARFVRLPSDTVDREIERALKQILDFFELDRCGLLGVHKDQRFVGVTHACYAEGIEQVCKEINLAELFPWSYNTLVIKGLPVKVERITQLPPEAEHDYQSWLAMGVKSNLAIPMFSAHGIQHLIVMHSVRKERDWPQGYISRLCLLGEIFVNALERRKADQALGASEYRLNLAAESAGAGLWSLEPESGVFWLTDQTRSLFGFPPDKVITVKDFLEVVHPDDREQTSHTIVQARQLNEETVVEYRIIRSDGDVRWMISRGRFHSGDGEEANRLMGVSVDITERKRTEKRLEEQLGFERLLADISGRFIALSSDQIDGQIKLTQKSICDYLGIDACVLWQMPPDQHGMMFLTHFYAPPDIPSVSDVVDGKKNFPWSLEMLLKGQTLWLPRLADAPPEAHRDIESSQRFGIKSRLTFPLSAGGVVFGALSFIMMREERNWSEDVRSRMRLIAEIFANALIRQHSEQKLLASKESLRVFTRKLLTIQEEERRRLARELHDDFTQRLAVLAMELSHLEAVAKASKQAIDPTLIGIREEIVQLSADIHDISRQLHPSIIEDLGLGLAMQSECSNFARRTGIAIDFRQTDIPRTLPLDIAVALFRITQEALRNIQKHAQAKEAEVYLIGEKDRVTLTIHDSGTGFDAAIDRKTHGLGLFSMQERVQLVRGVFSIHSAPGQGTQISIIVPLKGMENG